jgi:Septum formation
VDPWGIRAGVTALVVAGLALSGCGLIGNPLADKAKPSAAVTASPSPTPSASSLPEAGQCHSDPYVELMSLSHLHVVDCSQDHFGEIVYVGQFPTSAGLEEPPRFAAGAENAASVAAQRDAYETCSGQADKYLGRSWIHMLVQLRIALPDDAGWANGQRWYSCDLYRTTWDSEHDLSRPGSLRTQSFDPICIDANADYFPTVTCEYRHPSEYAGSYLSKPMSPSLTNEARDAQLHEQCWSVIGKYLGLSGDRAKAIVGEDMIFQYRTELWPYGRRVVHCFTWTGSDPSTYVTGSAKGRKGKGL